MSRILRYILAATFLAVWTLAWQPVTDFASNAISGIDLNKLIFYSNDSNIFDHSPRTTISTQDRILGVHSVENGERIMRIRIIDGDSSAGMQVVGQNQIVIIKKRPEV